MLPRGPSHHPSPGPCRAGHLPHSSLVSTWLQREGGKLRSGLSPSHLPSPSAACTAPGCPLCLIYHHPRRPCQPCFTHEVKDASLPRTEQGTSPCNSSDRSTARFLSSLCCPCHEHMGHRLGLGQGLGEGWEWDRRRGAHSQYGLPPGHACLLGPGALGSPGTGLLVPTSLCLQRGEDYVLPRRTLSPRMPPTLGKVQAAASERRRGGGPCWGHMPRDPFRALVPSLREQGLPWAGELLESQFWKMHLGEASCGQRNLGSRLCKPCLRDSSNSYPILNVLTSPAERKPV